MVLSNVIVDVTIPRRSFVFGQSRAQVSFFSVVEGIRQTQKQNFTLGNAHRSLVLDRVGLVFSKSRQTSAVAIFVFLVS